MSPDDETCEVTITAPDADWLEKFTKRLLADRLCAAAHIFEPIRSTYWWQGEMREATESRAALHTRRSLVPAIVARINQAHPYEVPGVTAQPIVDGNPVYLAWIKQETEADQEEQRATEAGSAT
jgi:periplasmic divalent cation tolerance protein